MDKKLILLFLVIFLFLPFWGKCQYVSGLITAKFNPANQLVWEKYGLGDHLIQGIHVDANSNVYIVGLVDLVLQFEDIVLPWGLFVAKYDSAGNFKWVNPIVGGTMEVEGVVADSAENCYVMGRFIKLIVSDTCRLESDAKWDVYVAKYNKDGNAVWIKSLIKRGYYIKPEDISINEKYGHLYITGWEDSISPYDKYSKLLLSKFNLADGSLLKEVEIYNNQNYPPGLGNQGLGVANDDSSVYICGSLIRDNHMDLYVAKLDTGLNITWEKQSEGNIVKNIGYDIVLDNEKNVYVTGSFWDSLTLGGQTLTSQKNEDLFIAKFNTKGEVIWAKSAGSNKNDFGNSICFDNKNSIYISGFIGGNAEFTPTIKTENIGPFLAKLDKDGNYEFVKSYYTGYDQNFDRGVGYVACNKNADLFFATHFIGDFSLGVKSLNYISNSGLKVYPNPCHTSFWVNLGSQPGVSQLTLFNLSGQTVKEVNYTNDPVEVSGLPPGIYILNVKSGEQVFREKLIIE